MDHARSHSQHPLEAVARAARRAATWGSAARELGVLATVAVRYPLGVVEAGLAAVRPAADAVHDTPVVLVHGYGHNRSGWFLLERHLRGAGFANVVTLNYNPLTADVPELADRLARRVEQVRRRAGTGTVHVVGHSLGGVILRWYVQEAGGDERVSTAVTIASPHAGTLAALAGVGRTARQLRPGSWVMRRLAAGTRPSPVRWVSFYSNTDPLVAPARSAVLTDPALRAVNVLIKDHGHLSIMLCSRVARTIVGLLEGAEDGTSVVPFAAAEPAAHPSSTSPTSSRASSGPR